MEPTEKLEFAVASVTHIYKYDTCKRQEYVLIYTYLFFLFFSFQEKGFFIECGAYDGEIQSNTLTLERDLGWEGLLVEGDPTTVADLV